jgi:uncharacterized protein (TIGR02246 family)
MSTTLQTPSDVARIWGETYAARDLDAMMALFAPEAIWVSEEGAQVHGHDAIRGVFADFMALDAVYDVADQEVHEAGDVALLRANWTVKGQAPDGSAVEIGGRTADVLRRAPDGSWRYVIDSPFGGGQR